MYASYYCTVVSRFRVTVQYGEVSEYFVLRTYSTVHPGGRYTQKLARVGESFEATWVQIANAWIPWIPWLEYTLLYSRQSPLFGIHSATSPTMPDSAKGKI